MAPTKSTNSISSLTTPTTLRPSQSSKTYSQIHAPLLLAIYISSFRSLVSDPVSTAAYLLLPLAVLQGVYCALCLPAHGEAPPATPTTRERRKGGPREKENTAWKRLIPTLLSLTLSTTLPPLPIYILLICHGAPLTTHIPHNALLALQLSLLVTPQLFFVHGMGGETWCRLISLGGAAALKEEGEEQIKTGLVVDGVTAQAMGALVGTWLGAIPIPLDWDRPWQAWPVTVLTGAWVGACAGQVFGQAVVGREWRVGFGA